MSDLYRQVSDFGARHTADRLMIATVVYTEYTDFFLIFLIAVILIAVILNIIAQSMHLLLMTFFYSIGLKSIPQS